MSVITVPDPQPDLPAYLQALRCPCGEEVSGGTKSALLTEVRAHLSRKHPELVGRYDDDDMLAWSYSRPC